MRDSFIVIVGRLFQKVSVPLVVLDKLLSYCQRQNIVEEDVGLVCVLACPRSGSTLTYQILRIGLAGQYLSNLWNLLYAAPLLGGRLARLFSRNSVSSFSSEYGFVEGINGESEGMKFWSYWMGATLDVRTTSWHQDRVLDLRMRLSKLFKKNEVFITGYLGHIFVIPEIRKAFPKVAFVYVQRNLIENAQSIYRASQHEWFSTRPVEDDFDDDYRRIVHQLLHIHYQIFISRDDDYVTMRFCDIKNNPDELVNVVKRNLMAKDIVATTKDQISLIDRSFATKHNDLADEDRWRILFKQEIELFTDVEYKKEMTRLLYDK